MDIWGLEWHWSVVFFHCTGLGDNGVEVGSVSWNSSLQQQLCNILFNEKS